MKTLLVSIFVSVALTLFAVQARAQGSDPARSVEKADAALASYEKGNWEAALASFLEAEALYHSPVYVLYTAKCLEHVDRFTEAKLAYERVAAEVLPASAPEPWQKAKDEAATALSALDRRFPSIRIEVAAATQSTRVSVDGRDVPVGEEVRLDPGTHRLAAADGSRRASRSIVVEPGKQNVHILLELPKPLVLLRKKPASRRITAMPRKRGPNVPGLVLGIVGGAALIGGAVTGVLALQKADDAKQDLPESCIGQTCPESQRGAVNDRTRDARRFATISDGLFIGGGVLVTTGVLLLIFDPHARSNAGFAAPVGSRF